MKYHVVQDAILENLVDWEEVSAFMTVIAEQELFVPMGSVKVSVDPLTLTKTDCICSLVSMWNCCQDTTSNFLDSTDYDANKGYDDHANTETAYWTSVTKDNEIHPWWQVEFNCQIEARKTALDINGNINVETCFR